MSKRFLAISDGSEQYHSSRLSRSPEPTPRKRKSRWGAADESDRTFVPGMPTQLPPNLDPKQEKMYILQLQIEDMSRRLKTGELGIPRNPEDRSPSPEPMYSTEGKRLNTREYRVRKKMEDDRHSLIQQLTELNPDYKPPSDYKAPQNRITDKVYIPQDSHPDINFVGLLIGPRGNTLKALEKETGAKVIIRGKGSVKEGKVGRRDGLPMPGEDEPLHAFISAPVAEAVENAANRIKNIIRQGIDIPESQNDLRRAQLRELALLNGTLREHEGLMKLRAMAEAQSIATNKIQCSICGGAGHLSSDCKASGLPYDEQLNANATERAKMDSEYSALMAELGVGAGSLLPPGMNRGPRGPSNRPARQPPPPGVASTEDEDDTDSAYPSVNGNAGRGGPPGGQPPQSGPNQDPYGYRLPPPPPPPPIPAGAYPPSMMPPGPPSWSAYPMMGPGTEGGYPAPPHVQAPGAPSMSQYPPAPSTAGGTYASTNGSIGATSWSSTNPNTTGAWGDPASMPPAMAYGGYPAPYGPANYWGPMYGQPMPNPPPPPPPGV